jgi:tetratricopeptide (TPR) repeat protein
MRKASAWILSIFALGAVASAQPAAQKAPRERPAGLLQGLGGLHHPIATRDPEAQKFFDEGLTLVYGFNHAEAIAMFERASELDPHAVMPLWGIAYALGPNINMDIDPAGEKAAYDALQRARAVASGAPANERAYVEALAKRYSNALGTDYQKLAADYAAAMKALSGRYPDDLDAATLYAESLMDLRPWRLWEKDGRPAEGTLEIVSVLESVLKRDPNHVGANHYYIHTIEASPHPERALPCARRLETLVPAAGHLVHMPAHVYIRTGDYERAIASNETAVEADREFFAETGETGIYPLMYYNHNLHFLAAAAMMAGRYGKARKAADEVARNLEPAVAEMPMAEFAVPMPLLVLARFGKWEEILAAPEPAANLKMTGALWHYARGLAFAAKDHTGQGRAEREAMANEIGQVPKDALFSVNNAREVLGVALKVLDGRIAEAHGDRSRAIEDLREAVAAEDALVYDEPPSFYYPVRESLGAALYRDGRYREAEKVFREDLDRNPRNGRALFGLWQCLLAEKRDVDAAWIEREYREAWNGAEIALDMGRM